jgi:hypothetical protein
MSAKALLSASVSAAPGAYVEDVFSTYLYTGNGSTQTITNGIDLAGEGGLVWIKSRSPSSQDGRHQLFDTARGIGYRLFTNDTSGQNGPYGTVLVHNLSSTGFTVGSGASINYTGENFASWTFRKQPKFFDVVTYTGDDTNRTIAHNLGSVPGCIIVKKTSGSASWNVYHRSTGNTNVLFLNLTDASAADSTRWNNTTPTATEFSLGTSDQVNQSGNTYVAYLFAHDAGGFGDAGTDNAVSCGSYTGNGSATGPVIDLGWEPQWVLIKASSRSQNWNIMDNMRGILSGGNDPILFANLSAAENTANNFISLLPNGFAPESSAQGVNESSQTYIYIAIRRGPMRTPESGTEVFETIARSGTSGVASVGALQSPDLVVANKRQSDNSGRVLVDRLRGSRLLRTSNASAEADYTGYVLFDRSTGVGLSADGAGMSINQSGSTYSQNHFRRAPGFFDVVAYTGTSATHNVNHNLGVAPELIIHKPRNSSSYYFAVTDVASTSWGQFGTNAAFNTSFIYWNNGITDTYIGTTSSGTYVNESGYTYIAYLFATLAGVSKVGSYTGTGTTLSIDCGFTAGARFVLIKRTDSTGDWYVWDTARGITSGNDPYLLLNSTAAEVTNTDYIDPLSSGFQISSTAPAAINASGGSYIYLSIA